MNSKLLKEYEEFEGLSGVPVDEDLLEEKEDENDPSNRPAVAATLSPEDFSFEVKMVAAIVHVYARDGH